MAKNLCSILDGVPYEGRVTLSTITKNGKKVELAGYNHALPKLSEVFARAMCGYDVSSSIPRYLMAKQGSSEVNILNHPVLLTGTNYSVDDTTYYYVSYNALITDSMLATVAGVTGNVYLFLLDSENNELAKIALVGNEEQPVTDLSTLVGEGKNLLINWRLRLTNSNNYDNPGGNNGSL